MVKYPLTELGYVAQDFKTRHILTYPVLCERVSKASGVEVKEPAFQQARRSDRGYETLRKTIMDYMLSEDPELVEASLATYDTHFRQKGA